MSGARRHVEIAIVGSGPAGYTAALYAARAELSPVMLAGFSFGGQLMITTDVENYPGFPDAVAGPELMELFQKQAERFGAEVHNEDVTSVDLGVRPFRVETEERSLSADALIIATGASAKWLGLPSEQRLMNKGVSACATCDGALYRGERMAVVGGGDSALEEALFLTRFASSVHLIHRRDELRASRIMQQRAREHPKLEFVWNSVVEEILGDDQVRALSVRNLQSDEMHELEVGAVFIAIGHQPNSELFTSWLETDPAGYLRVEPASARTKIPGVFACGDVMDPVYRQAVTAAGSGCMAAIDAERWLAARG